MNKQIITPKMKRILLLVGLVSSILLFGLLSPEGATGFRPYTVRITYLFYAAVIVTSLFLIDWKRLTARQVIMAVVLGTLGMCVNLQMFVGVAAGVTTGFAYLAIQRFLGEENYFCLVRQGKEEWKKNLKVIFLGAVIILVLRCMPAFGGAHQIEWHPSVWGLFASVGAGVSEEMIYRMFLFAVLLKLGGGKEPPTVLTLLVLGVPFALIHNMELLVYGQYAAYLNSFREVFVNACIFYLIVKKRDYVTAATLHSLIDIVIGMVWIV